MWILLENEDFYHLISMDYLAACSLAYLQINKINFQQTDYKEYLKNKKIWELINLEKLSFKGLNPFNWLEERPETIERPNSTITESRDWDQMTPINLSTSQVNSSINKIDSSFSSIEKSNVSQILEEKQFMVKPTPLEQVQQQQIQSCCQSSRQLIKSKVGEFCSFIDGKLLDDNNILKVIELEDGLKSYLIFSTVMKGGMIFEREIVMISKLSFWLRSQMDQFSMACQTQVHEGIPQSEKIEMEQQNSKEEQFRVPPKCKIKRTVKEQKIWKKSSKRKE